METRGRGQRRQEDLSTVEFLFERSAEYQGWCPWGLDVDGAVGKLMGSSGERGGPGAGPLTGPGRTLAPGSPCR